MSLVKFFNSEQRRSAFGYLGSALIANLLNNVLSKYTALSVQQTSFISIYIVGNIILYSYDILVAKQNFFLESYKGIKNYYGAVAYSDVATRLKWLGQSFYQKYIFRFVITVILDTIIGLSLLKYTIQKLDDFDILKTWKYRNIIVATAVSALTFFLYLSTLRFKWAYEYKENILLNIIVMVWLSIAILIKVNDGKMPTNTSWRFLYKADAAAPPTAPTAAA